MRRTAFASFVVPFVLAALPAAEAGAATVTLSNWTWGNGNSVSVNGPAYSGAAGGFSGTLSGTGVPGLDGAIQTYCVDLGQSFSFGVAYSDFTLVDAASYFGVDKANSLTHLMSWVVDQNLFGNSPSAVRDDLSTALQLAIWNLKYDGDQSLGSGSFTSNTRAYTAALTGTEGYWGANALLASSASSSASLRLWVLQSPTRQDQLLWQVTSTAMPEPASGALVAMAGVAALAVRRRRRLSAGA